MSLVIRRILFSVMLLIVAGATVRYAVEYRHTQMHLENQSKRKFKTRDVSSIPGEKAHTMFEGKASGIFQVESSVRTIPGSRVLVFDVKANQSVRGARLKWHLPAAARTVNGAEDILIASIEKGETRRFELEVADLGGRAAFAEIFTFQNGMKFGATAPFSDSKARMAEESDSPEGATGRSPSDLPSHSIMKFDSGGSRALQIGGPSGIIQ